MRSKESYEKTVFGVRSMNTRAHGTQARCMRAQATASSRRARGVFARLLQAEDDARRMAATLSTCGKRVRELRARPKTPDRKRSAALKPMIGLGPRALETTFAKKGCPRQ